jgi:hypothetical protein
MPKLSILGVYRDTWHAMWRLRVPLLQALIIPTLGLALIELGVPTLRPLDHWPILLALQLAYLLLVGMFAVSCHRTVLLGPEHLGNRWGLSVGRPVLAYMGYLVGIGILVMPLLLPLAILGGFDPPAPAAPTAAEDAGVLLPAAQVLTGAAVVYVFCRLSLVLPAAAVRMPGGLAAAWDRSHRQGWRVALAELLPGMTVLLATWPLHWLAERSAGFAALWLPVATLLGAVWVVALSCTFARLPLPNEDAETDAADAALRPDEAETGSVLG